MLRQCHRDRRRNECPVDLEILDDTQELRQVEPRHRHQPRPGTKCHIQKYRHAIDVEERQHCEHPGSRIRPQKGKGLRDIRHEVAMGENNPLRPTRRARGIRQYGDLLGGVEPHLGRWVIFGQQVTQRRVALGAVEHDHMVVGDSGPRCRIFRGGEKRRHREEEARLRVAELRAHLLPGVERVDSGRGGTRSKDAVEYGSEGGHVGRMKRHDITESDAPGRERPRHEVDLADQLAIGCLGTGGAIHDRDAVQIGRIDAREKVVVDTEVRDVNIGQGPSKNHVDLL